MIHKNYDSERAQWVNYSTDCKFQISIFSSKMATDFITLNL